MKIDNVTASAIAEQCQRNWNQKKKVSDEHINEIIQVATNMPTKQNREYYQLVVSTDIELNKQLYSIAIDDNNPGFKKQFHRNGQVLAPLLLLWFSTNPIEDKFDDDFTEQFQISIGISAGAAALHATSLGYKTGYCCCMKWESARQLLKAKGVHLLDHLVGHGLALGIGHPKTDYRGDVVVDKKIRLTLENDGIDCGIQKDIMVHKV